MSFNNNLKNPYSKFGNKYSLLNAKPEDIISNNSGLPSRGGLRPTGNSTDYKLCLEGNPFNKPNERGRHCIWAIGNNVGSMGGPGPIPPPTSNPQLEIGDTSGDLWPFCSEDERTEAPQEQVSNIMYDNLGLHYAISIIFKYNSWNNELWLKTKHLFWDQKSLSWVDVKNDKNTNFEMYATIWSCYKPSCLKKETTWDPIVYPVAANNYGLTTILRTLYSGGRGLHYYYVWCTISYRYGSSNSWITSSKNIFESKKTGNYCGV